MIDTKMKRSFDVPTQVAFYDAENELYIGGIAYGDEIICLECGATIEIADYCDEIEEVAPHVQFPIIPMSWCNISDACLGDAMFDINSGEVIQ